MNKILPLRWSLRVAGFFSGGRQEGREKKKKNGPNGLTVLPGHMAGESLVARSSEEEVEGKQHKGVFC